MTQKVLMIGRWVVDFLFAEDKYDIDGVIACLYDIGAPGSIVSEAEDIMYSDKLNTGFTVTNSEQYLAVVVIGPASSGKEFIDTLVHEVHHLAVVIAKNLGIDLDKEAPAYIAGDASRELAEEVCRLGCSKCSKK